MTLAVEPKVQQEFTIPMPSSVTYIAIMYLCMLSLLPYGSCDVICNSSIILDYKDFTIVRYTQLIYIWDNVLKYHYNFTDNGEGVAHTCQNVGPCRFITAGLCDFDFSRQLILQTASKLTCCSSEPRLECICALSIFMSLINLVS